MSKKSDNVIFLYSFHVEAQLKALDTCWWNTATFANDVRPSASGINLKSEIANVGDTVRGQWPESCFYSPPI